MEREKDESNRFYVTTFLPNIPSLRETSFVLRFWGGGGQKVIKKIILHSLL